MTTMTIVMMVTWDETVTMRVTLMLMSDKKQGRGKYNGPNTSNRGPS